jgi:hypothetical protein
MIIAYCILLAIPLSLLCGGRFGHLGSTYLRWIWLPIAAFSVEAATPFLAGRLIQAPISQWLWATVVLEYGLLFLFCLLNWKRRPIRLIALACFLNFFVIVWYGFRMPVSPVIHSFPEMAGTAERIQSGELFEYVLADWGSPFLFLGDALIIPFVRTGLASMGDILLGIGVSWLIFQWMRPPRVKKRRALPREQAL